MFTLIVDDNTHNNRSRDEPNVVGFFWALLFLPDFVSFTIFLRIWSFQKSSRVREIAHSAFHRIYLCKVGICVLFLSILLYLDREYSLTMAPTQPQGDPGLDKKSSSSDKKTPDRRLVQLNLKSVPASIKNSVVSEKSAAKKTKRNSSTDCDSPNGAPDLDNIGDIRLIHESIADIKNTMVRKTDVKEIVTSIISELKSEIKSEILAEVKATIMPELTQIVTDKIKNRVWWQNRH